MKALSIIIPVYKTEKYIHECVDSVLREAPENSEIILVDDGSPDNCPRICDEYAEKDARVRVIHQSNKGLSGARNAALNIAEGEKIFFIDSDDFLPEEYFSVLLSEKADLVIGNYKAFYDNGTADIIGCPNLKKYESISAYLKDFHCHFATLFNFAWGKIYDGNIIKQFNLRFEDGVSMVEDVLFNLEYYKHCSSIVMCREIQLQYRQIQGSLSKKLSLQVFDWYVHSYSRIKMLLVEYDSFTKENEIHFYSHFVGNALECILGYWNQPNEIRREKYEEIFNNELLQDALPYHRGKRTKGIVKALQQKNVRRLEKSIKHHLFWANVRKKIRRLL